MRKALAVLALVTLCLGATSARAERRLAFVVGINAYGNLPADAQLAAAVNDATTVAGTLREIGFQVTAMTGVASLTNFARAFAAFNQQIEPGDTVLFYYAGHGVALDNQNYLLPADIPALDVGGESIVKRLALAETDLISDIQARGARVTIMVIDACRNNPFPKAGTRSLGKSRGLSLKEPPQGVYSLYSAGSGQEALDRLSSDDPSPNSVFTRIFVAELRKPGTNLLDLGESVREEVSLLARTQNHAQVPGVYNQIVGARRILLSNLPAAPAPSVTAPVSTAATPPAIAAAPSARLSPEPSIAVPATTGPSDVLTSLYGPPRPTATVTIRRDPTPPAPTKPEPARAPDEPAPIPTMTMPALPLPSPNAPRPASPSLAAPKASSAPRFSQPQQATLIEEGAKGDAAPRSSGGRVVWRTEPVAPGGGARGDSALLASVDFPDDGLALRWELRPNHDASLPASHTIALVFEQTGIAGKGRVVSDVGLPQSKASESERGHPLSGLPVKVRDNLFLVGLSGLQADIERNVGLLRDGQWFDLALRYSSGRRAVITFEKRDAAADMMREALGGSDRSAARGTPD